MLNQYKNITEIQNRTKSVSGERLSKSKTEFLDFDEERIFFNSEISQQTNDNSIELHIHSEDNWITANYNTVLQQKIPTFKDKQSNETIQLNNPIGIDLYEELKKLNISPDTYDITINFFKNLIGDYSRQHLRIDEISPDRTELRLRAIDEKDAQFKQQITNYIQTVKQTSSTYYKSYLLNFNKNNCILFVNSVVIGEFLYVKLNEPLPDNIVVDFKCWVVEELKPPFIDKVTLNSKSLELQFNKLSNPNWQANYSYNTSAETNLKSYNDLLGSSVATSQQIVDNYFSGSLSGIKLNIDYSDFNNFVFYSSAKQRVENFRNKLESIEQNDAKQLSLEQISGSNAVTNANDFFKARTDIISKFDEFENYLYYQSSSKLTTFDIPLLNATVSELTGSYISPVPKTNSTYPYNLVPISSSKFTNWYDALFNIADKYDRKNLNSLIYSIPSYLRQNDNFSLVQSFTNMLGHHYDILYTYVNEMGRLYNREENPKLGMPNELLYSAAKQYGWTLTNGNQNQDLWQYVFGTNESGIPITGSNTVGDPSVPGREMTYTIWRRILNNLPFLLKSKGTKKSIKALLSCYGIPESLITINEFGGPRLDRVPVYEKLNFDYSLDLIANTSGTVITNYSQSINSIELRFRTDNVITNPNIPGTMNLFSVGSNNVTIDFSKGTLGTVQINGTSSANIELFDGKFLSTVLRTDGSNLELVAKKSKFGKIVAAVSCSTVASFPIDGSIILGGTGGASRLQGQLQELRIWSSSLQDKAFDNHVKAPGAYNGNIDAYSELIYRLPLNQKIDHSTTSSLSGVQPVVSNISSSFSSWTNNIPYDSIEETYYYDSISIGAGTFDDNKVRIEDNKLIGNLDVKARAEISQFDKAALDSKKLAVYFSPQTMINEDIIAQFGDTNLDEFIGDPGNIEDHAYVDLINEAQKYWKKYREKNSINSYINMFTLFDLSFFKQLQQLVPARVDLLDGILVKPNILERNKDTILPKIQKFDSTFNVNINNISPTASSDYLFYDGEMDAKILTITAEDDDQYQGFLTASTEKKYNGTQYSRNYLIKSGSTYISAISPIDISDALLPFYSGSTFSEFKENKIILNNTASYVTAQVSDFLPIGINNQKYNGCKMSSPDFNINSPDTIDGKPVVEFRSANPNQLIYQNNGTQGSFIIP